jgi:hypothetical protein
MGDGGNGTREEEQVAGEWPHLIRGFFSVSIIAKAMQEK